MDTVLRDVDWKTMVFLGAVFCLVQAFTKTGLLQGLSLELYDWFGAQLTVVVLLLLAGNATLIGGSANIVSVGIFASHRDRVSFRHVMRYGVPITVVQLSLGAVYVLAVVVVSRWRRAAEGCADQAGIARSEATRRSRRSHRTETWIASRHGLRPRG